MKLSPLQKLLNKVEPHEGWTNKATWAVQLWLENDYGHYKHLHGISLEMKRAKKPVTDFAPIIQEYTETYCVPHQNAGTLEADLLSWALAFVNWKEIAEAWMEE